MSVISKIRFIEQMEKQECGLACLAMLMYYYNYPISIKDMRERYGTQKNGLSFANLLTICSEYGVDANAYKINITDLKALGEPCIIHWNHKKHFVILSEFHKKYVNIVDPALGEVKVAIEEFKNEFTGSIFVIESKNKERIEKCNSSILSEYLELIYKNKELFLCLGILSLMIVGFGLIPTFILGQLIDELLDAQLLNMKKIGIICAVSCGLFLLNYIKNLVVIALTNRVDWEMMSVYLRKFLYAPLSFLENRNKGDLVNRFALVEQSRDFFCTQVFNLFSSSILIVVYFAVLFSYSISLGCIVFVWNIIGVILLLLVINESFNLSKKNLLYRIQVKNHLVENVNLIKDIKLHSLESERFMRWVVPFCKMLNARMVSGKLRGGLTALLAAWQLGLTFVIFFIGGRYVVETTMTFGTLYYIIMVAEMLSEPIISLCTSLLDFVELTTVYQRIDDTKQTNSESGILNESKIRYNLKGKIEFRNVSFGYSRFQPQLFEGLSCEILPNEVVLIKGESGSGKSTLINLILGIYEISSGEILIDDIPLADYDIWTLRRSIAFMSQEETLFNTSILENIVLDEKYDEDRFDRIIRDADLVSLLSELPEREKTVIMENGANFSQGQKQRILLARTLYKDAPIIILDEATNSLHKESEEYILEKVCKQKGTKIIIVHHDVNILSDKTFLVEKGKMGLLS